MALILGEKIRDVDIYHAIQICLVHDLAESITGDVDSYRIILGEVTKEQKHQMEEEAMLNFKNKIPNAGDKIYKLWEEYDKHETEEAKYARALDKIEALIHLLSVDYIAKEDNAAAELVAKYADNAVKEFPQLKPMLDNIKTRQKKEFEKQGFEWKKHYN